MTKQTIGSGRYQILRELGSGGFGVTYLVKDSYMPSQPIRVAKQLRPIEDQSEIYRLVQERFQREAVLLEELAAIPKFQASMPISKKMANFTSSRSTSKVKP